MNYYDGEEGYKYMEINAPNMFRYVKAYINLLMFNIICGIAMDCKKKWTQKEMSCFVLSVMLYQAICFVFGIYFWQVTESEEAITYFANPGH